MDTAQACVSVVDDDALVLKSVGRLLQSVGYSVRTFSSGQAFLEYRGEGAFITARYTRSQSQAFGLTGFVDTQNGVVNARFELGPRFHVEANPGVYQNERAGILTTSYQAELKAEYRFSTRAAFESAYLFQYQDRFLSLEDASDSGGAGITRNTVLFGLKLFTVIDAN